MAGLTVLEQVAGSHCMRPLNPAVSWTPTDESSGWMKHWGRLYLKTSGYGRAASSSIIRCQRLHAITQPCSTNHCFHATVKNFMYDTLLSGKLRCM